MSDSLTTPIVQVEIKEGWRESFIAIWAGKWNARKREKQRAGGSEFDN